MDGMELHQKRLTAYGLNNKACSEVANYLSNQFDHLATLEESKSYLDLLIRELKKIQAVWNELGPLEPIEDKTKA